MAEEKDLDDFRQQWKKELEVKKQSVQEEDDLTSSSSQIHLVDYNPLIRPSGSELASVNQIDNHDDDSLDGLISNSALEQKKAPLYNYNESTDSSEYYPFRILTQFLNEAPKKAKVNKNSKQPKNSPGETYSKRKYFQSTSSQQTLKVLKTDPVTMESLDKKKESGGQRMLDIFLADLDEINEIPFFDSTLAREVAVKIFQYLDMKALCRCAQVSRSWRSLADDEHLWCTICHQLGCEQKTKVGDFSHWKNKVREFVEEKQILESNWKARVGRPYNLSYAKGGVLCAVHSHELTIVAGYSNCNVKSWNMLSGDSCTFNASNTSMVIDESAEDLCRIYNELRHLKTTAQITAASFRHGFVDIWWNDLGTEPIHTVTFNSADVSSLCIQDCAKNQSVAAASQKTRVHVTAVYEEGGKTLADFNMQNDVKNLQWLPRTHSSEAKSLLLISTGDSVWLKEFHPNSQSAPASNCTQDEMNLSEIHSIFMAPVTCTTVRPMAAQIGVGFNMTTGPSIQIKVNVYDVDVCKLRTSLKGHTWLISAIHMPQGLSDRLVTGSGDRKVRLFDAQAQTTPVLTLAGHSAKVTCVQMDEVKVVSGDEAGFVCVWDQRMGRKLWELHNRHPVQYCHFDERLLIIGNVPYQKFLDDEEFESVAALRYRGTVQCYDFLANQQRAGIPEICLSSYNEPEASVSNLGLTVPYDSY